MMSVKQRLAVEFMQNRRNFLAAGASLSFLPVLSQVVSGWIKINPSFPKDPFTSGVASGDPSPSGFVLWTRLAPEPLQGGGLSERSFN